ncbi:MAG: ribbon-helix-helix protein, CopG family [Beijerinckiaceae bacterium]|jgi:hypothetical protein
MTQTVPLDVVQENATFCIHLMQGESVVAKQSAISVRLPDPIKRAIDKAAEDDHRSTASLVEKILADWLTSKKAESKKGR